MNTVEELVKAAHLGGLPDRTSVTVSGTIAKVWPPGTGYNGQQKQNFQIRGDGGAILWGSWGNPAFLLQEGQRITVSGNIATKKDASKGRALYASDGAPGVALGNGATSAPTYQQTPPAPATAPQPAQAAPHQGRAPIALSVAVRIASDAYRMSASQIHGIPVSSEPILELPAGSPCGDIALAILNGVLRGAIDPEEED